MSKESDHIMQFFTWKHLPGRLQETSHRFCLDAEWIVANLPDNPERDSCLRLLLMAKDAAVRAEVIRVIDPKNPRELTEEEKAHLRKGRKINAIKMIRERTGCDLLEAKEAAETAPLWERIPYS